MLEIITTAEKAQEVTEILEAQYDLSAIETDFISAFLNTLADATAKNLPIDRDFIDSIAKDLKKDFEDLPADSAIFEIVGNFRTQYPYALEKFSVADDGE